MGGAANRPPDPTTGGNRAPTRPTDGEAPTRPALEQPRRGQEHHMAHTNPLTHIDVGAVMRAYAVLHHEGIHEDHLEATMLAQTLEAIMAGVDPAEIANHIAETYGRSAD